MEITEIRVKLVSNQQERLLAFCTVTFDAAFVIRDVKIIGSTRGPFVAMPSRKVNDRCPRCSGKNHLRASYCNECGYRLDPERAPSDPRGRPRLHVDVAHPINKRCRTQVEEAILKAYEAEKKRSLEPGYRPPNLGDDNDDVFDPSPRRPPPRPDKRKDDNDDGELESEAG